MTMMKNSGLPPFNIILRDVRNLPGQLTFAQAMQLARVSRNELQSAYFCDYFPGASFYLEPHERDIDLRGLSPLWDTMLIPAVEYSRRCSLAASCRRGAA